LPSKSGKAQEKNKREREKERKKIMTRALVYDCDVSLTNLALSKIPAIIPALNAAQLTPISAGTETNVFVTGEFSWIISDEDKKKSRENVS
jgi:hypothetical protein